MQSKVLWVGALLMLIGQLGQIVLHVREFRRNRKRRAG